MGLVTKPTLTLYTRNGCHLCEKAKEVIRSLQGEFDFEYKECDIALKDEWTEKYGLMIPVVTLNEKEIQYGTIEKTRLYKAFAEIK